MLVVGTATSVLYAVAAAGLVACAMTAALSRRIRLRVTAPRASIGAIVRPGAWFTVVALLSLWFARVDVLMIDAMKGAKATAYYGAALAFVSALQGALAALMLALFPVTAQNRTRVYFRRLFFRAGQLTAAAALVAAALQMAAPFLIGLLFGGEYRDAAPVLAVMVWAFPMMEAYLGCQLLFETTDHLRSSVVAHTLMVGTAIGVNLWLIPAHGAKGAAWGLIAGAVAALLFALPRSAVIVRRLPEN